MVGIVDRQNESGNDMWGRNRGRLRAARPASRAPHQVARLLLPAQIYGDIAWDSVRKTGDLGTQLEAERLQLFVIVLICALREALERFVPVRLEIVDAAPAIIAVARRKTQNLDFALEDFETRSGLSNARTEQLA